MELLCKRRPSGKTSTVGVLTLNGHHLCYTLEDVVREVAGQPVECWKVDGQTAIPAGRYQLTLENSGRFGPNTMTLNKVPGFVNIRVHAGNTDKDTEGCPLLGTALFKSAGQEEDGIMGGTSRPAVDMVKALVAGALSRGEQVWWTVTNA